MTSSSRHRQSNRAAVVLLLAHGRRAGGRSLSPAADLSASFDGEGRRAARTIPALDETLDLSASSVDIDALGLDAVVRQKPASPLARQGLASGADGRGATQAAPDVFEVDRTTSSRSRSSRCLDRSGRESSPTAAADSGAAARAPPPPAAYRLSRPQRPPPWAAQPRAP